MYLALAKVQKEFTNKHNKQTAIMAWKIQKIVTKGLENIKAATLACTVKIDTSKQYKSFTERWTWEVKNNIPYDTR